MFAQKTETTAKGKVPSYVDLNQLFREYSRLEAGLRRDVNFSSYVELLGLKGVGSHGQRHASSPWEEQRDMQQKLNKMQIPMFDGVKMTTRAWLHQLQTYFTLNPNMLEDDAMHFASLHLEEDAPE